mmetsp:Transcript_43623/g.85237  ORF Transcript_43623/g.85237 Transcript_43623/m.85237 type:complete len:144 (-) Transcript_43623:52-483(-)
MCICIRRSVEYAPLGSLQSSSCVPSSATTPSRSTTILSAPRIVDSLCATTTTVLPSISWSSAAWTARSLSVSRALVASSSSRMRGLPTTARAMAMRCFCPPLICAPLSPHSVSYPSGRLLIKLWALPRRAASSTSASEQSGLP